MDFYKQEKGADISTVVLKDVEQHQNMFDAYKSTIMAMAAAINAKDPYPHTSDQIERVINTYRSTVKAMGVTIGALDSLLYSE